MAARHVDVTLHRIRVLEVHRFRDQRPRRQRPQLDQTHTGLRQLQEDESFCFGCFGE
jgi:hypothetical protein